MISLGLAMLVGGAGLQVWPFPVDHPLLALIAVHRPAVYAAFLYGYATVWFTTPFLVINSVGSFAYIFLGTHGSGRSTVATAPVPAAGAPGRPVSDPGGAASPHLLAPAAEPRWLTIPERGLYTGLAIVGAIGTGKTSACMYPYVEQLVGGTTLTIRKFPQPILYGR